ncbi:IS6 family transposase [Mesorhizobium sp. M0830]|uniref:IS6 family transposase n=1 Tax=Mesorhizobium sp. M0830 TaxID=2957008 RepID=UPI0033357957
MFNGHHIDQSVILLCVRWYLAYTLSLRDLEEMMAECGLKVDHSTVHRWVAHFSPQLLERFNRRKRAVGSKWHMDETYIKVRGHGCTIDSLGDTVELFFSENRDLVAAQRFLHKALTRHGRPERIVIDGSQTNYEAILSCDAESRLRQRSRRPLKPIRIRNSRYLNNRIEQDHRRIKRRIRPSIGFKSQASAVVILSGIEMIHMMGKRQARYAYKSVDRCFDILNAEMGALPRSSMPLMIHRL